MRFYIVEMFQLKAISDVVCVALKSHRHLVLSPEQPGIFVLLKRRQKV